MAPTGKAQALADYVQSSIAENRSPDHKVMTSFSKEPSGWAQVRSFVSRRSRELASSASKPLVEVPEAERPAPLAVRKLPSRTVDNAGDISPISEPDSMNYIPWDPRMSVSSLDTTTSRLTHDSTDSSHIETASYVPYARFQQRDVQVLSVNSSPVSTRSAHTVGPAQMQNNELDSVLLMGYAAQRRRRIPNALRPGAEPLSRSSSNEKPDEEEEIKEPEPEPTVPEAVRIAQAMLEGEISPIATSAADDSSEQSPSRSSAPPSSSSSLLPTITLTHPSVKDTTTRPRSDHPALLLRHKRSHPRLREQPKTENRPQTWTSPSTRRRRLNGPLPPTPYEMAIELGLLGDEDRPRPSTPTTPASAASSRLSSGRYTSTMTTASSSNRNRSSAGNSVGSRSSDGSVITIPRRPLGHRDFRPAATRVSGAWGPDDVGTGETGVGGDEVRLTWVDAPASPGSASGSGSSTTVRSPQQWLEQFRPLSFDELNVGFLKEGEGEEEEEEERTPLLARRRAVRIVVGKGKELWRRSGP